VSRKSLSTKIKDVNPMRILIMAWVTKLQTIKITATNICINKKIIFLLLNVKETMIKFSRTKIFFENILIFINSLIQKWQIIFSLKQKSSIIIFIFFKNFVGSIPSLPKLIIEPSDEVHFTYIPNTNIMSSIYINNDSNMKIMFRV